MHMKFAKAYQAAKAEVTAGRDTAAMGPLFTGHEPDRSQK